jgi:hypothetical protein
MGLRHRTALAVSVTALMAAAAAGPAPAQQAVDVPPPAPGEPLPTFKRSDYRFTHHYTERTWRLAPNTTQVFRMPIERVREGVLTPCWGFDITGPDIRYAVAGLGFYGPVRPVPGYGTDPRGEHPVGVRQADGTLAIPPSHAKLTVTQLLEGWRCHATGWRPDGDNGLTKAKYRSLDRRLHDTSRGVVASRARLKRHLRRVAAAQPFTVTRAAIYQGPEIPPELELRISAGAVPPGTTVRGVATVEFIHPT